MDYEIVPDFLIPAITIIPCCPAIIASIFYTAGMLIETNANEQREDYLYGLDFMGFADYTVKYFSEDCKCSEPETGRYLKVTLFVSKSYLIN